LRIPHPQKKGRGFSRTKKEKGVVARANCSKGRKKREPRRAHVHTSTGERRQSFLLLLSSNVKRGEVRKAPVGMTPFQIEPKEKKGGVAPLAKRRPRASFLGFRQGRGKKRSKGTIGL